MPAAPWRAGFPTVRVLLAIAVFVVGVASPVQATFYPPPWRLAILFDRDVWQPTPLVLLRLPLHSGAVPLTFEE
jgi:hypothetical protein